MELHLLPKLTENRKRRVGRGIGSGRAKTSGRGTKGQKARRNIPAAFEGGALPLIKRLPFRRGKGRNKVFKLKPIILNLKYLNVFADGATVDLESIIKHKLVKSDDAKKYGIKILGEGEINKKLNVLLSVSKSASEKIKKAGGSLGK